MDLVVVFVHGWSVTHTKTYGKLPERLAADGKAKGLSIKTKEIHLGRYISFHDEVQLKDIARAFEAAVQEQLGGLLKSGRRFVCITHSTGGPVLRTWWSRYYQHPGSSVCPMSHLIMLAPANYGSALAVLGKGKLSRMKSWYDGVEPGQGVLDWLALGSDAAWKLNREWIESQGKSLGPKGVFAFVLTGQSIDRAFYDNLNSYTGELGSDGVVRVAAANLTANYLRLLQQKAVPAKPKGRRKTTRYEAPALELEARHTSGKIPLRLVPGRSHSGKSMGIMFSVKPKSDKRNQETVDAIISCLQVSDKQQYRQIARDFDAASQKVQADELLETRKGWIWDSDFIHDQFAMVIFRVTDHEGYPVTDFDLILTAGANNDPNDLPKGFFADRQLNAKNRNTVTYYFNSSIMNGCEAIVDTSGSKPRTVREKKEGAQALGFRIIARPESGFAHYLPCSIAASSEVLANVVSANQTTMIDIVLRRVVAEETFRLDKGIKPKSFKKTKPGKPLAD